MRSLVAILCSAALAAATACPAQSVPPASRNTTTTTLSANPDPATVGEDVALIATVRKASGEGSPTGSVTFSVDSLQLKTVNLNPAGIGNFTASANGIHPGIYPVLATYSGDSDNLPSTSTLTTVKVEAAPTRTTLEVAATKLTPPASDSLTATVVRSTSGVSGAPTGFVTFLADNFYVLATIKLDGSGAATFTASSRGVTPGTYAIIAKYTTDPYDAPSTSSAVNVTVK